MKRAGKVLSRIGLALVLAAAVTALAAMIYMVVLQSGWKGARREMTMLIYTGYEEPGTMEYAGRSCPTTQKALKFYYEMIMSSQSVALRPLRALTETDETITLRLVDGTVRFTPRDAETAEFSVERGGKERRYLIHLSFKWRHLVSAFEDAEAESATPAA